MQASNRIREAVAAIRTLRDDGFSLDALLEIATGDRLARPDRAEDEHPHIVALYREEIEGRTRPVLDTARGTPIEIDPTAAVFVNFERAWPRDRLGDRSIAVAAWNDLGHAERAEAIAAVPAYLRAREQLARPAPSASAYLRGRYWRDLR